MSVLLDTSSALDQRTIDHLRPLDATLNALAETDCRGCQAILAMLLRHLEASIPAQQVDQQRRAA